MDFRNTRWKDWINPVKWWSFVWGTFLERFVLKRHIIEQYIIRLKDPMCRKCVEHGKCDQGDNPCYCSMPDKMWVQSESCSNGNWGPFRNEQEWEEYKAEYGVEISVEYTKE